MKAKTAILLSLYFATFLIGTTTAQAFSLSGYRWAGNTMNYYINSTFASSFRTAMRSADSTWDAAGSIFRFNYSGTTNRNPNGFAANYAAGGSGGSDDYSDIGYFNAGANGIVAKAQLWATANTLEEGDITLNTYYGFSTVGVAGSYDVQNIITHEMGHWLRLLDVSSANNPDYCFSASEATMCFQPRTVEDINMRSLRTNDKDGVIAIYGT